ncbi:MAG: hypothetical protein EOO01_00415 [Chitinophagaceae bacterium]|nr:MAG: hypothetical protein EOO01_00415 [Chitinophagaceae bacterium]
MYRITFAANEIISITPFDGEMVFQGDYYYHESNGLLIFAIVRAASEERAHELGRKIIQVVKETAPGSDGAS